MIPSNLQTSNFARYPSQARKLAVSHLPALRRSPLVFLPSLLRELIEYDYKFPAERLRIEKELQYLDSLDEGANRSLFDGFLRISLSSSLELMDWVDEPAQFIEQQSAFLWTTHQLDGFRQAATTYGELVQSMLSAEAHPLDHLGVAIIGRDVPDAGSPLFRRLREHGTYFGNVRPENGLALILDLLTSRATANPVPYGHWYIDGGQQVPLSARVTCVSYNALAPVRVAMLDRMKTEIDRPGMGPEQLRTAMAKTVPADVGRAKGEDEILERFQLRLFTEGSGTQIFSTSFAQWATREALRRAQPLTLVARFAPRQRQKPMNELLSRQIGEAELDLAGSLVDADMASYYQWIDQRRLPQSERSSFLVWYEGQNRALMISPSLPRGTQSSSNLDLGELLALALA